MNQHFTTVLRKFEDLRTQNNGSDLNQLLEATTSLLKSEIDHYDWVGFYLLDAPNNMLVLGPFTGKPTEHTHIPVGKGVCGQVAEKKQTMIVQDVTLQENYIACSLDVQSEIVVPILKNGVFVAEIDIDSHAYAPFSQKDNEFLTAIANQLADHF